MRHAIHAARSLAAAGLILSASLAVAQPARARTAEEAKDLTERAVAYVHAVGRETAFTAFGRPDGGFVDGELYVFCLDASGTVVAHGGNPSIVGRDLSGVRDPDGRYPNVEANRMGLDHGRGWVRYRWPNPVSKRIEPKSVYVIRVDDHTVCGSGFYEP